MTLLSLPEEVIEGHLLPFLGWNDLLRFRKVCKSIHGIVKGYMKVHPELAPELEVNEEERTFGEFMKLGIPTTKLFLNNISDYGHGLYDKQWNDAKRFLQEYGPLIKSLRVKQVSLYIYSNELEFLEALVNLEEFTAGHCALDEDMEKAVLDNLRRANHHPPKTLEFPVPESFARLKALKIGSSDKPFVKTNAFISHPLEGSCLLNGTHLEYLTPPVIPKYIFYRMPFAPLSKRFALLTNRLELENYQGRLKEIDFVDHHDFLPRPGQALASQPAFYHLLRCCARKNIILKNVAGSWLQNQLIQPDFGAVILSLVNLHTAVLRLNMDHLERIEIRRTSRSDVGTEWRQLGRPEWPALQSLDVNVDSVTPEQGAFGHSSNLFGKTLTLLRFLFEGVTHMNLTELRLSFEEEDGSLPNPKIDDVVASCPNLKKLTLVKLPGINKGLLKFWNGLPGLEEVSLEYCKSVGNFAFVGEDWKNPAFLKLKNLKKLTLKGLDQMPRITDRMFSVVIRHLSLTHFIVTSDGPVQSVTPFGIESLLGGRFAETIQKFPFQDWSLNGVSSEEWKKLEKKFRSYEML